MKLTFYPFFERAKLSHSNSSLLLQRRVVDFSSERSINKTAVAIKEHYRFDLSTSAITKITHATSKDAKEFNAEVEGNGKESAVIIAEIDGSMIPIVEYKKATEEQKSSGLKKDRDCHWREARLCFASNPSDGLKRYGVTIGSPFEAGCMMSQVCKQLGMNDDTLIHGVGDGAPWIADQYEEQFGMNHDFYIDFYHACEYLAEAWRAVTSSSSAEAPSRELLDLWQEMLKESRAEEVVDELKKAMDLNPEEKSIAKAYRYLETRIEYLNYRKALDADLPIGSGEVESGHRSVLQSRLKKPGAWWRLDNAENMAHLKVMQANDHWEEFWAKQAA